MDLNEALRQFDLVEANLSKLDAVWSKMSALIPDRITFIGNSPTGREYRSLERDFLTILANIPAIDGWRIESRPPDLDELARDRIEAFQTGEIAIEASVDRVVALPGQQIDEYRHRLSRKRHQLVHGRLEELIAEADESLAAAVAASGVVSRSDTSNIRSEPFERFARLVAEADRLVGEAPRGDAWSRLHRHLHFALGVDLLDIHENDWPEVKALLREQAAPNEPHHVAVTDMGALVASRPSGRVSSALAWSALQAEDFERLMFAIISSADGYENPDWLMRTNAPDRARDLSVHRVRKDALGGVMRDRVIIQCKHWLSRSVGDTDISDALTKIRHWEPPVVASIVFATSGRFTADAVRWTEQHNHAGTRPTIELWPESHLEQLLAQRPSLVVDFGLR